MINIIYQDDFILVINKPSGINCIPDGYDPSIPHLRSILEPEFGRLWIVHRLDKETSGIVILARSAEVHRSLNIQFTDRKIKKQYSAIVFGNFLEPVTIEYPLFINGDRRHRTIVDNNRGKAAVTEIHLSQKLNNCCAEVFALPHTGYTHQIRAHLCASGFPILSDPFYSTKDSKEFSLSLPIQHTALHAKEISFVHPGTNEIVVFCADPPIEYLETIAFLK
jgi:tRNA pseudouridine32 synthase / 23S rRNA pseudouridine746 synthase